MYDVDNDGKLSSKEIEAIIKGINNFYGNKLNDRGIKTQDLARHMLKKYDRDHNEFLTEDEFMNGLADPTLQAFDSFRVLRDGVF